MSRLVYTKLISLSFEQHYSDSVTSISSVKDFPANVIKISAVILNHVSFSLFDRCDSDKPEKILEYLASFWLFLMNIAWP